MKKFISIALAATIELCMGIPALAQYPQHTGGDGDYGTAVVMPAQTDESHVFYIDGHPFVMLDTDEDGNYFVIADEYYGKGGFSYTSGGDLTYPQRFDINSTCTTANRINAAVYMNSNEFISALPKSVSENIVEHDWQIEFASNFNGYAKSDKTTSDIYNEDYNLAAGCIQRCKIAVPSRTELNEYGTLIGYNIEQSGTCLSYSGSAPSSWLVRTPLYEENGRNDRACKVQMATGVFSNARDMSMALRPVFFLRNDFFETVKVDVGTTGSIVIDEIKEKVSDVDAMLDIGYSYADLVELGYLQSGADIELTDITLQCKKALPGYEINLNYTYNANEIEDCEKTSVKWFVSTDGDNYRPIANADKKSYIVVNADAQSYIKVKITPISTGGAVGKTFESDSIYIGNRLNSPPNSTVARLDNQNEECHADTRIETSSGISLALLDYEDSDGERKYFVTMNTGCGVGATYTNKFDPDNEQSIAYALNKFLTDSGNVDESWIDWSGDDSASVSELNSEIRSHLVQHDYLTEASPDAAIENDYVSDCEIALMSYNEFIQYAKNFGYMIPGGGYWALRTTRPDGKLMIVDNTSDASKSGRIVTGAVKVNYKIRPVFWLDSSFFTDVKLNLSTTGKDVLALMRESYTTEQLSKGNVSYTDDELSQIGFEFPHAENVIIKGISEAGQTLCADFTYVNSNTKAEKRAEYIWYCGDADNGFEFVSQGEDAKIRLTADMVGKYIKVCVTPLTSYGAAGIASEYTCSVPVRGTQPYNAELIDLTASETSEIAECKINIEKLTAGTEKLLLAMTVFDEKGCPIKAVEKEIEVSQGSEVVSIDVQQLPVQMKKTISIILVDTLDTFRPIFTVKG